MPLIFFLNMIFFNLSLNLKFETTEFFKSSFSRRIFKRFGSEFIDCWQIQFQLFKINIKFNIPQLKTRNSDSAGHVRGHHQQGVEYFKLHRG